MKIIVYVKEHERDGTDVFKRNLRELKRQMKHFAGPDDQVIYLRNGEYSEITVVDQKLTKECNCE